MIERFLVVLALVASVTVATDDGDAFLVALLPEPIYEKANTTWPIPPAGNVNHLKVTIMNLGYSSDDVGFHTYLPDYAEMTSFTMQTDGVAYSGKTVPRKVAQEALAKAKDGDHVTAVHAPKRIPDIFGNQIQAAENTVHIKSQKQMTFDVEYKETIPDMIESGVKLQNRAQVLFDLYGSTVQSMVGEVFSPNYPYSYPNSADVSWLVRVPDDKFVRLSIVDLDIEECCDRLTIYDGNSFSGSILASLSGNLNNQNNLTAFVSTGSSLSLHLTSDCSETRSGFRAITTVGSNQVPTTELPIDETTVSTISACSYGDHLDIYSGYSYIISPNYPNYYYNNMQCSWTVHSHNGYYIKLTVLDLALGYGDALSMYDGSSQYYPLLANYTGYAYPDPLYSSGYYMFIEFQTDSYNTNRGFQLKYETSTVTAVIPACANGENLYVDPWTSVNISSPEYPNYYYNNLNCTWMIHNHYSGSVELTVQDLSLNSGDEVSVYDGNSGILLARFTYSYYYSPIYSYSEHMQIVFSTDSNYVSRGFQFWVTGAQNSVTTDSPGGSGDMETTVSSVYCDGGYSIMSGLGNITSPFYPSYYQNNMQCSYSIQSISYAYYIKLTVQDLALASYDTLTVYDGFSEYDTVLASYTGYWSNVNVTSSYNAMLIKFQSDSYYTNQGFRLQYETIVNCSTSYYLTSSYGTINSNNYGYGNYPDNLNECWIFPSYYDHVHLTFNSMNTESFYDPLTIYSYDNYVKSWDGSFSDDYSESVYPNCYNNCGMWMSFTTDGSVTRTGFSITYTLH